MDEKTCQFCFGSQTSIWRSGPPGFDIICQSCYMKWTHRMSLLKESDKEIPLSTITQEKERKFHCKDCNIAWSSKFKQFSDEDLVRFHGENHFVYGSRVLLHKEDQKPIVENSLTRLRDAIHMVLEEERKYHIISQTIRQYKEELTAIQLKLYATLNQFKSDFLEFHNLCIQSLKTPLEGSSHENKLVPVSTLDTKVPYSLQVQLEDIASEIEKDMNQLDHEFSESTNSTQVPLESTHTISSQVDSSQTEALQDNTAALLQSKEQVQKKVEEMIQKYTRKLEDFSSSASKQIQDAVEERVKQLGEIEYKTSECLLDIEVNLRFLNEYTKTES